MRKGKSLIGMRVISETDGADLGRVKDLVFDHDANHVLALLMSEKNLFGLIDAQVIPWNQISIIGPDAITVASSQSRIKAGEVPGVQSVMHRNTALSGTRVFTTDGRDLGTLADTFLDDQSGQIQGYELSGGFVSDTVTGKKFLPADFDLAVGRDVALVPPAAAQSLEAQSSGLQSATQSARQNVSQSINDVYDAAKAKVTETFDNIAGASVEKQKQWVVGKTAGRDVIVSALQIEEFAATELGGDDLQTPAEPTATDVASSGEVVEGEILIRKGDVISAVHADMAARRGVLGQLVAAALVGAANDVMVAGSAQAEAAALGKTAAREVLAPDGSVVVAEGQIITAEILEHAHRVGKDREVFLAAGLGAATQAVQNTGQNFGQAAQATGAQLSETTGNLWESARQKIGEWTHAAHDKKAELDAQALNRKINHAVGRPITRLLLDRNDDVILNAGDIITNAAAERAREAGVLEVLLNAVQETASGVQPDSTTPAP